MQMVRRQISVNGFVVKPPIKKGYAMIVRSWKVGAKVNLALLMKAQRIKASDKTSSTTGRVMIWKPGRTITCD